MRFRTQGIIKSPASGESAVIDSVAVLFYRQVNDFCAALLPVTPPRPGELAAPEVKTDVAMPESIAPDRYGRAHLPQRLTELDFAAGMNQRTPNCKCAKPRFC